VHVLQRLEPTSIAAMRAAGLWVDVFVGLELDADQLDLVIPPRVMLELGRLALPLTLVSHD
jgi:hypothetical protein